MKLYLTRHGQSLGNLEGRFQGSRYDSPLTEEGIDQAKKIAQRLKEYSFDEIFSSDLQRVLHTSEEVRSFHPKIPHHIDPRLRELDRGVRSGEIREEHEKGWVCNKDPNSRFDEGESVYDQVERVRDFVSDLIQRKSENILIISHGGTMKALLSVLLNLDPVTCSETYKTGNCCLYILNLADDGSCSVELANCQKHLEEELPKEKDEEEIYYDY
ncbi:MAG: histidine phosphatase family protein [Candidatus Woesearchaeota archaeon]|nr:histidine phosphatase family protein [Nanoarchaeota archaeon]USN44328.1 MAG: histidine phosphatase family protein [Candidatus Woesearchaeota archaeon]